MFSARTHHPSATPAEQDAVATLVERCRRCVAEALDGLESDRAKVLEEAAAVLTRVPPLQPVTDDFLCWAFAQGREWRKSVEWIASPGLQDKLAAKGLLDDPLP